MKLLQDYQTEKRHQRNHKFELTKQINEIEKSIEISNKRLENEKFMKNAKPELIDEEKSNKEALEMEFSVIKETLKELGN